MPYISPLLRPPGRPGRRTPSRYLQNWSPILRHHNLESFIPIYPRKQFRIPPKPSYPYCPSIEASTALRQEHHWAVAHAHPGLV